MNLTDMKLGVTPCERILPWPTEWKIIRDRKDGKGHAMLVEGEATSVQLDYCGDVLPPSALAKHLPIYQETPLYTYCHNCIYPIGTTYEQELSRTGLSFKARIISDPGHELATLTQILIREGCVTQSSIGYDVVKFRHETRDNRRVRILEEVKFHEIAAVPLGMNRGTSVSLIKAMCPAMKNLTQPPAADDEQAGETDPSWLLDPSRALAMLRAS